MNECTFCKIVNKKIPCYLINDDEKHIAFMDIFPPTFEENITMPVVLVITKKHLGSNVFEDLNIKEYEELLKYTRKIARAIQKSINPLRVCMVFEGLEINHIHTKLYPISLDYYPGYLSTKKGPNNEDTKAPDEYLIKISEKIRNTLKND